MFDSEIDKIGWKLLQCVSVKDRKHRFRVYKQVFLGTKAVDFLVASQNISREQAVEMGQSFLAEGLFEGITSKSFKDDKSFYRFTREAKRMYQLTLWGKSQPEGSSNSINTNNKVFNKQMNSSGHFSASTVSRQSSFNQQSSVSTNHSVSPQEQFSQGVKLKDRKLGFKTFRDCFVGSQAVDFLCASQNMTRKEAVELGQRFMNEGVFYHVTHDHHFEDSGLFYRLTTAPTTATTLGSSQHSRHSSVASSGHGSKEQTQQQPSRQQLRPAIRSASKFSRSASQQNLHAERDLVSRLRRNVVPKDHKFRAVHYPGSFSGTEATDFLSFNENIDREDAVALGQAMMDDGVFHSLQKDMEFQDSDRCFFQYHDDAPKRRKHRNVASQRLQR